MSSKYMSPCSAHALLRSRGPTFVCSRPLRPPSSLRSQSKPRLWRAFQTERLQAFAPLPPSSLPKPAPPKTYTRPRRWARRLLYLALGFGTVWALDKQFYASSLSRSTRTFATIVTVAIDYKINFRPQPLFADSLEALHARNATRIFELLHSNGGLYLKIGQAIGMQSAVLPPAFQAMFKRMFDDAPQNDWADVQRVIREDFGRSVEEVFGSEVEKTARASASVAQVHWARLKDGREVAIKVQKREIASQVGWDLWTFRATAKLASKWFDIPFYSVVPFITERLNLETDFVNEADNSERMAALIAGESRLRGRVYIPKVYRELSSRRVMTAEWIEGVRLWDKDGITKPWRGGYGHGSPGCRGEPLDSSADVSKQQVVHEGGMLKPERTAWKGVSGRGGLGLSLKDVMTTIVDLFSAQMFLFGSVHCDPHPGNIFIRRQPSGRPELVLIDHGLYVQLEPKFRHDYSLFWKSLLTFDNATLIEVVKGWGVNNADIFASATLMRPYSGGDHTTSDSLKNLSKKDKAERAYEMHQKMRKGMKEILGDETKWPKELIFIGRNLRIVQGNNQYLGSPVNRLKITGTWASRALVDSPDLKISDRITNFGRHLLFKFVLLSTDLVFYGSKVRQFFGFGKGMEDDIEAHMKGMAKDYGVELNHEVFEG